MHILLIHQAFASIHEPGGTRHHEFARHLAQLGHQVSIIASPVSYLTGGRESKRKVERECDGKITIYRTYTFSTLHKSFAHRLLSFFSFMVSALIKAIQIKKVDIVWGTTPPIFQSATAWFVALLKNTPFLLEVRDLWPAFAVAVGVLKNRTLIHLSLWLEKLLYRRADRIIINSPGYRTHIQEKGGRNIHLIPNGADPSFFEKEEDISLRDQLGWTDHFIVVYAGAHGMSNDLGVILKAANLLKKNQIIQFVLIGAGKEKKNLMHEAQRLELSNLTFLNPVPKNKIAAYLHSADACVAILKPIELYRTTYPNKVFDYMAAGKPVLLAIDGVIRNVIEDAHCGIFCEPGNERMLADQALSLSKNPKICKRMGKNGREYVRQHFNRKTTVMQFAEIINQIGKNNG